VSPLLILITAGAIFSQWAQLPISQDQFLEETKELQTRYFPETKPLPGAQHVLERLKQSNIEIALATSSNSRNYDIKTAHLGSFFSVFEKIKIVKGDDPRLKPGRGKPAPDIFVLALKTINDSLASGIPKIHPEECLVFEDSVPGVEAGRRAGMQVAWVPHEGLLAEYRGREAEVLAGLTGEHEDDGTNDETEKRKRDESVQSGREHARVRGQAGELGDKWAVLYPSLEDFPLENYGIV
jgi:pseudouridine-5'-monophosphatase